MEGGNVYFQRYAVLPDMSELLWITVQVTGVIQTDY